MTCTAGCSDDAWRASGGGEADASPVGGAISLSLSLSLLGVTVTSRDGTVASRNGTVASRASERDRAARHSRIFAALAFIAATPRPE